MFRLWASNMMARTMAASLGLGQMSRMKGDVDFDRVDGELLQVIQRRVSFAKIVRGQLQSPRRKFLEGIKVCRVFSMASAVSGDSQAHQGGGTWL